MTKSLLFTALLCTLVGTAQNFEWQWAKSGGGTKPMPAETPLGYSVEMEHIVDIAVDANNNYYFLALIGQQNTEYDGTPVNVYNAPALDFSPTDVLLFSTDCQGALRWTQTIGGADRDFAYQLVLDNNGGLYIGASILNISGGFPNTYLPPHFSPTDAQPVLGDFNNGEPQEGFKTSALLKYSTADGSLVWRVMPQGDVSLALRFSDISQILLHPDGSIVALIGLKAGTHLSGQITVPESFTNKYKYHLVKFNPDGTVISVLPLSMEGGLRQHETTFRYDANLDRYYLAGFRNIGGTDPFVDLSFGGVAFSEQAYILAFNAQGNEIWRKELVSESPFRDNKIFDLEIDSDSNLYLCGRYFTAQMDMSVSMGDYEFPRLTFGHTQFTMKVGSDSNVQWITVPSAYTTSTGIFTGVDDNHDLVLKGDRIVVASQVSNEVWGNFSITRPVNHHSDPALLTLDKATGTPLAVNDVMGFAGYDDAFTAIATDNDGNLVVGGFFRTDLYTAANDNLPNLHKVMNDLNTTDFFIAKFADRACGAGLITSGFESDAVGLYPNPTAGIVQIDSKEPLSDYEITGVLGQVLLAGNLDAHNTISIESLGAGVYIIHFKTKDNRSISRKIIKQ